MSAFRWPIFAAFVAGAAVLTAAPSSRSEPREPARAKGELKQLQGTWTLLAYALKVGAALLTLVLIAAGMGAAVSTHAVPEESAPLATSDKIDPDPEAKKERVDPHGDPLPDQAILRIGTTRLQHEGQVRALAASEDGRFLASSGSDKVVRVWDAKDGRPIWKFALPSWGPWALAFSRNGKELAAVSRSALNTKENGDFRRWDLMTGRALPNGRDVPETLEFIYHVALASQDNGEFLAAETAEADISLYSPGIPKSGKTLKGHTGRVMSLCFTKDGKTLVSLGDEGMIRFWNTGDGKEIAKLPAPPPKDQSFQGNFAFIAVSPDGKNLAVSLPDNSTRLLDAAGRELRRLPSSEQMHALAFSPNGKALITGRSLVHSWHVDTAESIAILGLPRNPLRALSISPDGQIAAFADNQDRLQLVEIATGKTLFSREFPSRGGIAFCPRGQFLAVAPADNTIALWSVAKLCAAGKALRPEPAVLLRCQGKVEAFVFAPDGKRLATVEEGKFARIYELASKKVPLTIKSSGRRVYAVAFSADGKLLSTTGEQPAYRHGEENEPVPQSVGVWDSFTGKELAIGADLRQMAYTVAFHPNGKSLAALHLPVVAKDLPSGSFKMLDTEPRSVDDRMATIRLWDVGFSREKYRFEDPVRRKNAELATAWMIGTSQAETVAFSPDGRLFAAPGPGGIVLFETASGQPRMRLRGHLQGITALAFTPDGNTLVSTSSDSTALIWDVTGLRTGAKLSGSSAELWALLADANAEKAGRAVWALVDAPAETLSLLRKRLRPVAVSQAKLRKLAADLDHSSFAVRDKAGRELTTLGLSAEATLMKALQAKPSLEASRRIETLLLAIKSMRPSLGQIQAIRGVEVLEQIGSREAVDILRELAAGAEGAYLTSHAIEAMDRTNRRSIDEPATNKRCQDRP